MITGLGRGRPPVTAPEPVITIYRWFDQLSKKCYGVPKRPFRETVSPRFRETSAETTLKRAREETFISLEILIDGR